MCKNGCNRKVIGREMCSRCYNKFMKDNPNAPRLKTGRKRIPDDIRLSSDDHKMMHRYGITTKDRKLIWENQGMKCKICFKVNTNKKHFPIDHCHETGRIRGIICNLCNAFMGYVDRDITVLDRMKEYKNEN